MLLCSYLLIPHMMNTNLTISKVEKNLDLRRKLEVIRDDEPNSIRAYVADVVLYRGSSDLMSLLHAIRYYGSASSIISELIYSHDKRAFYDQFYREIEALREDYEDSVGDPLRIHGDRKNFMAWFAFGEIAYQIADQLVPKGLSINNLPI